MSEVRASGITSTTRKTYRVRLEGAPVRDCAYSRNGRQYRPQRLTVVRADGNVSGVELHGAVLKKDGNESQNDHTERLYRAGDWPAWLVPIVRGLA